MQSEAIYEAKLFFSSHLNKGETLIWAGKPSILHVGSLLVQLVFTAPAFYAFLHFNKVFNSENILENLFDLNWYFLLFLALIVEQILSAFIFIPLARKNTYYGLTNERVLIQKGGLFSKFTSLPFEGIYDVEMDKKLLGEDSVVLQTNRNPSDWDMNFTWISFTPDYVHIDGLSDSEEFVAKLNASMAEKQMAIRQSNAFK